MWIMTRDVVWEDSATEFGSLEDVMSRAGRLADNGKSLFVLDTPTAYNIFRGEFNARLEEVGKKNAVRVRAFDDDNNLYYECIATSEDDTESFFEWAMYNAGATYTMYEDFRGHWRYLHG